MKNNHATILATLLMTTLAFAGCTTELEESGIKTKDEVQLFDGSYTWVPPVVTDGYGNIITNHPMLSDESIPESVYQLLPRAGPEPTVGVTSKGNPLDPSRGSIFVVTLEQVQRSDDWGRTWEVVYDYTSFNQPTTMDVYQSLDPLLYVDPDTDYIFVSHLQVDPTVAVTGGLPWCQYLAWSKDNGKTWSDKIAPLQYGAAPGTNACMVGVADHQKLGSAKPGPRTSAQTKLLIENFPSKYGKVLYYCHQKFQLLPTAFALNEEVSVDQSTNPVWGTWCETSYDTGATWNNPVQVSPLRPGCPAGINGMPAAHPDGTVFVPLGAFGVRCYQPPAVGVSEDSGVTWTLRTMPNLTIGQTEIDPDITVTPDGTAYISFRGKDQHLWLARSKDKFVTWEGPWRVSPPDQTLNVFTGITSGDNGRIAIHYLGTRDAQPKEATPSNATGGSFWHSFISWSFNAADALPTFYTQQVTPDEDPIQIGCVWLRGGGGGPTACRNLLDFIDATSDKDGRVYAVTTDGCTPRSGCTTDTSVVNFQSRDREAAILVQDFGYSLFAEKGVLPRLGLEEPRPLPRT